MNEINEWFQMERDKEVRIQAEHVAAGRVCMIVSLAGAGDAGHCTI